MKRFTRILSLVFAVTVFVLYARCLCFAHIGLDDAAYTFRNPFVAGGFSLGNVVEAFTNLRHGGIWMPVTYMTYMLDASLCRWTGLPPIGEMHVVNVLLHAVNFLLLVKLISMLFFSRGNGRDSHLSPSSAHAQAVIAVIAAMVWAIHPLRAEPVAWIAARKELLWTLFALSGLMCWIKALEFSTLANSPTRQLNISTILFCALACLSKPTAMCFPLLALLVAWWCGAFAWRCGDAAHPCSNARRWSFIVQLFVFFLIAAVTGAIAAYSQTHVAGREAVALYAAPFAHRLVNALSAIGYYLRTTFWPSGLHVDCRAVPGIWPLDAAWNFAVLSIGAVFSAFLICGRRSTFIFSTAWFLVSLLPTLGLFGSFGIEAHADRFAYLPSMAFSFLAVSLLVPRANGWRPAVAVLILLAGATFLQLSYWRNDATAHQRALACDPEHPRAMVHVADARCSRQHDFDGGIRLYRQALMYADRVPTGGFDVEDVKAKLAYALATRGRHDDFSEVKRLGAAILLDMRLDRRGLMLDALGTAFLHDGDMQRAAQLFKASIDAPDRFWPKASTLRKLESCQRPTTS